MRERSVALPIALALAGVAFGVYAELVAGAPQGLALAAADAAVGAVLLCYGAVARIRRPASLTGVWMMCSGLAWFAGTLASPLVGLHRGYLVLLHLAYPSGRLPRSRFARAAVAAAMADSAVAPLLRNDRLTVLLSIVVATAARTRQATRTRSLAGHGNRPIARTITSGASISSTSA